MVVRAVGVDPAFLESSKQVGGGVEPVDLVEGNS